MKTVKTSGNLLLACQDKFQWLVVVVASFSKVCVFTGVFSENEPSTRQRYHHRNIVFKCFHFGDRFQKSSFSVKTMIVFDRFRVDAR